MTLIMLLGPHDFQIRCIDTGVIRVVDVNQLLTLPPKLMDYPAQVFEVYLCGVKPRDKDADWPEEVNLIFILV